jgi:cation diffusion facilitator family transporter
LFTHKHGLFSKGLKMPEQRSPAVPAAHTSLARYAWLSIAAAVLTIGLKMTAYLLTHSVGLLSDALESLINLAGALMALAMLTVAARPADKGHAFGHGKAEYFSSGVEGTLILIASVGIVVTAVHRLLNPQPIERLGPGVVVSLAASLINLCVAIVLSRIGKNQRSITLEANAQHLMTDVLTSAGVLVGIGVVAWTGWNWMDPVVALLVAGQIIRSGIQIIRRSVSGLMDAALPAPLLNAIQEVLRTYGKEGVRCHELRTRQAGSRQFVTLHALVPGGWTVERGHQLMERLETDLRNVLPDADVSTHLESLEDRDSGEHAVAGSDGPVSKPGVE